MPFPWSLPSCPPFQAPADQTQRIQSVQLDDRLTVSAMRYTLKREGRAEFFGAVTAVYGVTTVRADHMLVTMPAEGEGYVVRKASADGSVELIDPEATLKASSLEFDWSTGVGEAHDAIVEIAGLRLRANSVDIRPNEWLLRDVEAQTLSSDGISFHMRSMRVMPGESAVAYRVTPRLLNAKLGTLGRYEVSLAPEKKGTPMPNISYRRGQGLGVSWSMDYLLTRRDVLSASAASFPKSKLSAEVMLTHNLMKNAPSAGPRSETAELFSFGFADNIGVRSPQSERDYLERQRLSISLASSWNQRRIGDTDARLSKPIEAIFEAGSAANGWAALAQTRAQRISTPATSDFNRVVGSATVLAPTVHLLPNLESLLRVDARGDVERGASHGWLRTTAGLSWTVNSAFRVTTTYANGARSGAPRFAFDEPIAMETWTVRTDYALGPRRLGALAKYDPNGKGWFDHEYFISQIAGSFDVYALWRERPSRFSFGATFRPLDELDRIRKRLAKRTRGNHMPP